MEGNLRLFRYFSLEVDFSMTAESKLQWTFSLITM